MTALAVIIFFVALGLIVVLVASRSGAKGPVLDSQSRGSRRALWVLTALAVLGFLVAVPIAVGIDDGDSDTEVGALELTAQETHGRQVFNQHCVQCHTLGASNAVQSIGPNLDQLRPPEALVLDAIAKGRARGQGQMPAGLVRGPDAKAVAAYVAKVAGRGNQ